MVLANFFMMFFAWMPLPLVIGVAGFISFLVFVISLKVIAFVLDCLPIL